MRQLLLIMCILMMGCATQRPKSPVLGRQPIQYKYEPLFTPTFLTDRGEPTVIDSFKKAFNIK